MDEAATGAPIHAARSARRWALRAGAVLGFAAAAWFLGCSTAAADTPDALPPGLDDGFIGSVSDNAADLAGLSSSAALAGDGDDAAATASPAEGPTSGEHPAVPPVVTVALSADAAESAASIGDTVTHRTLPARPTDAERVPPITVDGYAAAHVTASVLDAVADDAGASLARPTDIDFTSNSPIGAAPDGIRPVIESADLLNLPAVSLIAPVADAIRPVLGAAGAVPLTPVTGIVTVATDALDGTRAGPVGSNLAVPPALSDPASAGGGDSDDLGGVTGGAETAGGESPGDAPTPMPSAALTAGAGGGVGVQVVAGWATPPTVAHADVVREIVDSAAGAQPDWPPRPPVPPTAVVAGAGVGPASNGGHDCAAWPPASGVSRHDRVVTVRGSERPEVPDHAGDPGFSPD